MKIGFNDKRAVQEVHPQASHAPSRIRETPVGIGQRGHATVDRDHPLINDIRLQPTVNLRLFQPRQAPVERAAERVSCTEQVKGTLAAADRAIDTGNIDVFPIADVARDTKMTTAQVGADPQAALRELRSRCEGNAAEPASVDVLKANPTIGNF